MRSFWILWKREIATYFRTPRATILLFFFLLLTGFNFCAGVHILNHGPTETSIVEAFFNTLFFWATFLLLIPLLTMHLFSEEYRLGTMETLVTAPVNETTIVLAKFSASFFFFLLLWLPSIGYFILFWPSAHQIAAASYGAYLGAYTMLFLMGLFFLSIGCLASAITSHQLIAAVVSSSFMSLFFFSGMISFSHKSDFPIMHHLLAPFSPMEQMGSFSRGIIDTRPIVWYLSMTGLTLFFTISIFKHCRHKN